MTLNPHLLRSHVWLYPRIIVPKSHENTSKYVDTVTLFAKTWTKGHWPLDVLCDPTSVEVTCVTLTWTKGHWPLDDLCDPTSVEVTYVTLPKDHCVQVPWEYITVCGYSDQFCKLSNTYTCMILRTTHRMSDNIVSFWTTFRRDKNEYTWTCFSRCVIIDITGRFQTCTFSFQHSNPAI